MNYLVKPLLSRLLKQGILALSVRIGASVCSFFVMMIVARSLGAESAGLFFLAITLITVISTLGRGTVDRLVMRDIASKVDGDWSSVNKLYISCVSLVLLSVGGGVVLSYFFSSSVIKHVFSKPEFIPVWSIMVWAVIPVCISSFHGFCFQGMQRITLFIASQGFLQSLFFLMIVGFLWFIGIEFSWQKYSVIYVAASFFVSIFLLIKWWGNKQVVFAVPDHKALLSKGILTFWFIRLLEVTLLLFAPIALGIFASSSDVAIYSVAQRIALMASILLFIVNSIVTPKFSEYYSANNFVALKRTAVWATRVSMLLFLPISIILFFLSPYILSLFGDEFVAGVNVLRLVLLAQMINSITGCVGSLLLMTGKQREAFISTSVACFITVVLCVLVIPTQGIVGAAWVYVVAITCQMFMNTYFVYKSLGFFPFNVFSRV